MEMIAFLRVQKDGYEPVIINRGKVLSGLDFWKYFCWVGIIGTAVDLITHNQGHYQEDPYFTDLVPVKK